MKKILFVLLAMLFTLNSVAQQLNQKKGMAKTMPFGKSVMAKPAGISNLHKIPMLKADEAQTVDVNITGSYTFYFDVDDEEGTSDWFFSATDDTGMYTVRLDWPGEYDARYGTFTVADLDKDYSYIKDYSTGELEYLDYVEGTTFTVSEVDGKLHIEGTLVCNNGVTYNLKFDHTPQTINVEGTELTDIYYFDEDTDWYMRFTNDSYRVSLDINTGRESKFAGTYTEANAVDSYNFVYDLNTGSYDPFVTFTVTFALPKGVTDPTEACEITGTALTEHGDTYNFHMLNGLPIDPIRIVDVDLNLKTVEWPSKRDDCSSYFEVTEKDNPDMQWNIGLSGMTGEFSTDDFVEALTNRVNTATGETMSVDNGTVSINFNPSTYTLEVSAALVMKDSVEYRFTFYYDVPVKGEISYEFNNLSLNDSYLSSTGVQWIHASNEKATMEVTLTNTTVPGDYDDSTMAVAMAVTDADGEKSAVTSVTIIEASTTLDDHNQPVLSAKFYGSNKRIYTIDAHLDLPTVADTLNISIDKLKASDLIDEAGVFQIYGYNADSTVYISLVPEATKFAGHYTTSDLTAYNSYSVLFLLQSDGTYEQNDIYTADFDVTQEDKNITLVGQIQAGSHLVNLSLKATIRSRGIDYDSEDDDLDVTFAADELTSLQKDENYNYAYVELRNKQRSDIFAMLIYIDEFDDVTVIPAGTYEVNDTYEAPSVQPGSLADSGMYPTFYATLGSDGYLYAPYWFLESGTVTVAKNDGNTLKIEVNGKNSWGCSMHVAYDGSGMGIKSAQTKNTGVRKMIEHKQVLIQKGDRKYTLSGQMLK